MIKKIKHIGLKSLHKKAWGLQSKYKRMSSADKNGYVKCYTCDGLHKWQELDLGHYIHLNALDFEPDNLRPQDTYCNRYKHGNSGVYAENLIKEIGVKRVERLRELEREYKAHPRQFKVGELEEIITTYQDLLKTL